MNPLSSVKHLLIDLDGTLLGNHELPLTLDFIRGALATLKKQGGYIKAIRALRATYLELGKTGPQNNMQFTNDRRAVMTFAKAMKISEQDSEKVLNSVITDLFPMLRKHFFPMPGAKEFLEWAHERYPLTLATNPVWQEEIIRLRLEWAGIDSNLFGFITHARVMHACKPDLAYYLEVIHRATREKSPEPSEFLLVGDKEKMDLPATSVGIPVFLVGQKPETQKKKTRAGKAPSWRGDFALLRRLLEESRA